MKILSKKKYNELILKSCKGMFGAVTDDMLLRENALLYEENKQLKEDKKKAIEYIKITIKIIKEQPSSCELNDIWILEHLNSFLEILGGKE